ncbi:MAG TPA: hypothetical protein VFN58_07435 [Candidatus Binatia bacterium]|nr:hypothetical protein [Candidatus Binatia bacterium]
MVPAQILVLLRRSDPIELFLPYVEQISQPGMRVVFLVQLGRSGFRELSGQLSDIHAGMRSAYLPETSCDEDAVENRIRSAEQQVNAACQSLRQRGVQLEIHSYGGPLQRVVQQYLENQNVQLVMMRPSANWVADLLRKIGSVFRFLKSPAAPPVLLLHPTNIPER